MADSSRETANRIQEINVVVTNAVHNLAGNANNLVEYLNEFTDKTDAVPFDKRVPQNKLMKRTKLSAMRGNIFNFGAFSSSASMDISDAFFIPLTA